jgi:hypothetical protein
MREEPGQVSASEAGNERKAERGPSSERGLNSGSELQRKYPIALALYAALAALVWFTMDAGKVPVWGKPVDLRLVPLLIIGGMALRTVLALQADKIRHGREKDSD